MIAWLAATLLSGLGFFLSLGLGTQWYLAWFAPAPVLWYAFSRGRAGPSFVAAFASYTLGATNFLPAYGSIMPMAVLAQLLCGPALVFALTVVMARYVHARLGSVAGVLAFAAGFAGADFLVSFMPAGGAATSPANSQVDMPVMAQAAALGGFAAVTFLIGLVAALIAEAARRRSSTWLLAAVGVIAIVFGFGALRMSRLGESTSRVALIGGNDLVGNTGDFEEAHTTQILATYAAGVRALAGQHVTVVVLPENSGRLAPAWGERALAPLAAAAREIGATVVVGYNGEFSGARRNLATTLGPHGDRATYAKRHLVVGLETRFFSPGNDPVILANGVEPEICKDMDFPATIRRDAAANRPRMFAVPAWDFGADGWSHARPAILRSIETGTPLARSARDGLLTLNDRFGRLVAEKPVGAGPTTLVGDLPIHDRGGDTLYARIGDAFAWICVLTALALAAASTLRRKRHA
ncbi:nitrilase-related carbon-nitrogen hydrolase [Novosphingobium sp. BL-8H]|uniref:nitrilase-related carbon-nitrogen hydrolase n=1 Tax=Novosphingobium sp. BL-8H TaxID=3127640 RepID=UPI00375713D4